MGCQEVYRQVNKVIEIDVGIRMAENDFLHGWKSDDIFLIWVLERVRSFGGVFHIQFGKNKLKMKAPTTSSRLDLF